MVVQVAKPAVARPGKMDERYMQAHRVAMQDARPGGFVTDRPDVAGVRNAWSGLAVQLRLRQRNFLSISEVLAGSHHAPLQSEVLPRPWMRAADSSGPQ